MQRAGWQRPIFGMWGQSWIGYYNRMLNHQLLQQWYASTTGRLLLQQEREWNGDALRPLYGMHLMQLGMAKENFAEQAVEVHHRFVMDIGAHESHSWAVLEGDDRSLPIATESLSAVVLPHVLEFSDDPHQVLREVTRVVAEDGVVVINGFSPWSLLHLRRRLGDRRYLPRRKVVEWLSLLGYELISERTLPWVGWSWRGLRFNTGCYQLVAKRRVIPVNPIHSRWRQRPAMAGNVMNRERYETCSIEDLSRK